ncbi:hypothetical protein Ancab_003275 [Ancistrocladus abbreviatus]
MSKSTKPIILLALFVGLVALLAKGLMPFTRSLWDFNPFRILEQAPLPMPKNMEALALAKADWKETRTAHMISLDVLGMKKEDIKVEVEENRVLRIVEEKKMQRKVIDIVEDQDTSSTTQDIKATKAYM